MVTEKLLSYYRVKGFSSLFVCFAIIFYSVMAFVHIVVDFTFELLDCVRCNEDFVISRFIISRFIHFTATLAGLKNIVSYTEDFVMWRCVKSRFHCTRLVAAV